MEIILLITIFCFLASFIHIITCPIIAFLTGPSKEEQKLQSECEFLKNELRKISMRDNYIEYVKVERKLRAVEAKLKVAFINKNKQFVFIKYVFPYGLQAMLGMSILIISIIYRYSPVIIFDSKFNFTPFGFIMGFPTNIDGAVSVPFWIFVNSFVSRTIVGYLK